MTLFADITFFELTMALVFVGSVERLVAYLPEEMVGPNGWLLTTGPAKQ